MMVNNKTAVLFTAVFMCICLAGCSKIRPDDENVNKLSEWLSLAELDDSMTSDELYKKALNEDTLIIYSVTSRVFDVKKSFENEYPGLTVTIKDMRGGDVVDMLKSNYANDDYACDLVICSDCNGSLYMELLKPGIVYSYIPWDIAPKMREGACEDGLEFMGETMMVFYNGTAFKEPPVSNIWELTDSSYKGKIIMSNPLKSFSTYEFCVALNAESEKMEKAYRDYFGSGPDLPEGKNAGDLFWEMAAPNIVFTNSSDEVIEGIGNSGNREYKLGIMLSSKMRYGKLGYNVTPIYDMEPFAAVYTPNSVTIAGGAKNINSAKLFIRYMMGETDGAGEGHRPFSTAGTWSTRNDAADGNDVPLSEINVIYPDKEYIYGNREKSLSFWEKLLEENVK